MARYVCTWTPIMHRSGPNHRILSWYHSGRDRLNGARHASLVHLPHGPSSKIQGMGVRVNGRQAADRGWFCFVVHKLNALDTRVTRSCDTIKFCFTLKLKPEDQLSKVYCLMVAPWCNSDKVHRTNGKIGIKRFKQQPPFETQPMSGTTLLKLRGEGATYEN